MKHQFSIFLFLIICFSNSYADNKIPSTIKEATIYRSGAKLHSVGDARLTSGENKIIFEKMPLGCNPQSIQVKIKGNAKLLAATFSQNTKVKEKSDASKVQRLADSLENLNISLQKLNTEKSILEKEEVIITENQSRVGSGQGKEFNAISLTELKELVAYYRSKITEIRNRLLDIQTEYKKVEKVQRAVAARHQEALNIDYETSGEITMQINSPTAQTVEITCIYMVYNASWEPIYDLRAESVDKDLNLVYKASLRQSTGVDWKNIKLHLSSAMPMTNNSRPLLAPKYVDYQVIAYGKKMQMNGLNDQSNMYQLRNSVAAPAAPMAKEDNRETYGAPDVVDFQNGETQSFNEVFDIENFHTIVSDANDQQIIEYNNIALPATFEYHAVPKLEPTVFLLAKIIDYGKYNLLSGNANIFYKDTYIGQSFIDTKTTMDTLLLSLGRDEDIIIKRLKPTDVTYAPKFFNNRKKEIITYDITVKNNKAIPINIEILDQIPISKNAEIEVELDEKSGAEYTKDYGKLMWRLKIPERKSKTVRFSYTVEYPKDRVVNCH